MGAYLKVGVAIVSELVIVLDADGDARIGIDAGHLDILGVVHDKVAEEVRRAKT